MSGVKGVLKKKTIFGKIASHSRIVERELTSSNIYPVRAGFNELHLTSCSILTSLPKKKKLPNSS